jgi:hypothetical protein
VRVERKTVVLGSISHHAVTDQENYWLSKGWRVIPPWPDEGGILKLERDVPDTAPIPVRYRPRRAYRRPRRAVADWIETQPSLDWALWSELADCESSGRWDIESGNGYSGGLQFLPRTWDSFGGGAYAQRPARATKGQQIAVARRVLAVQGWRAWPGCADKLRLEVA